MRETECGKKQVLREEYELGFERSEFAMSVRPCEVKPWKHRSGTEDVSLGRGDRFGSCRHLDDIQDRERKCRSPKRHVEKEKVRSKSKAGK